VNRLAIVRPPGENFAEGLTTAGLGAPDMGHALRQHDAYCAALEQCGLTLTRLEPDERYPDSTFVEDTALITKHGAILTRPGAPSRAPEVDEMRKVLAQFFPELHSIHAPGTLDAGDVCEADDKFFIGISERTNVGGAQQLSQLLKSFGYTTSFVDIRGLKLSDKPSSARMLHLKSGLAYLGDNRLAVIEALAGLEQFSDYDVVRLDKGEEYAANCLRIDENVLIAAGYSNFELRLQELGYKTTALDMSEFRKIDGGLSCL
jgi:dimethylargininase